MKNTLILSTAAFILAAMPSGYAGVGQSAVITLVFPYGARSYAMGEVGTALADDDAVLYYNPAGLAVPNDSWIGGSTSIFYQPLLPAFFLHDLWHTSFSAHFQNPRSELGQFGFFYNYINMGTNEWTDELGKPLGRARSHEEVCAFGWGVDLKELGIRNHYFGLTAKFITSALAPGIDGSGSGVGRDCAIDFGYLWTIGHGFRLGASAMNMGPAIYYIDPAKSDPIPFTINLALGYKKSFAADGVSFLALAGEYRLDREFVKNYHHKKPEPFYRALFIDATDQPRREELLQVNRHYGGEITLFNIFSYRSGYLIDIIGSRYEHHSGFGLNILNHFSLNYGTIYSPEGFMQKYARRYDSQNTGASGARHAQRQFSLTAVRLFNWSENDWCWWRER